ncbi:hypothetical protein CO610_07890 [Lysobacteraceae bacterium NML95-0200]|nr:hypothetical protein CO610_07890 [Xanthomonadaceae bacterium NML95-0200]
MLHEAFLAAAERLQLNLHLCSDANADFVVVDMDSLYGPLSWLQLYNAGVTVIGYTAAARSQTHFRLARDFDEAALEKLLDELAIPPKSGSAAARHAGAAQTAVTASQSEPLEVEADTRAKLLGHWLDSDELHGLVRLQHEAAPALVLDMDTGHYYGPLTLKPLLPLFATPLRQEDFVPLPENFDIESAGHEQQISRLLWFAALLRGDGKLLPPHDANARYRLSKWIQTEREYPKHLRIASVLMKAPASIAEIAQATTASQAEVADFLNACLAIGSAEAVLPSEPAPEPPRPGLLERLGLH